MKRISIPIFVVLLVLAIFSGCKKYIDIDLPSSKSVIVVNSLVSDTSHFEVIVSKSLPINGETSDFQVVKNASVILFEDGNLLGNLFFNQTKNSYTNELFVPKHGSFYKVEVEYSPTYFASIATRMPNMINNAEVNVIDQVIEESDEYSRDYKTLLRVKFNDLPSEKNYYMVTASYGEGNGSVWSLQPLTYKLSYKFFEGVSFTDQGFDGQELVVDFDFRWTFYIDEEPRVKKVIIYSLSEELYKFLYSYTLNRDMNNLPQAEPVIIFSSAVNGIGILGAYSISTFEFN